jgi:hypothetical protein
MADKAKFLNATAGIQYDADIIARGVALRDGRYRPTVFGALFVTLCVSIVFTVVNVLRTYQQLGGARTCAILYSIAVGIPVVVYCVVDWAYYTGVVGIQWGAKGVPYELYKVLRRDSLFTWVCPTKLEYIRPGMYHDDRVPRNNVGVWVMRLCVPALYALSLLVYWAIDDERDESPETPGGLQFIFGNALLALLGMVMCRTIVDNIYRLNKKWDYVPDALEPLTHGAASELRTGARSTTDDILVNSILGKRK